MLLGREAALSGAHVLAVRGHAVAPEIESGAETSSGAGENDHSAREIDRQFVEVVVQRLHEFARHGVQPIGTIESENGHVGPRAFEEHWSVGHRSSLPVAERCERTV